jgi:hypothetical protein
MRSVDNWALTASWHRHAGWPASCAFKITALQTKCGRQHITDGSNVLDPVPRNTYLLFDQLYRLVGVGERNDIGDHF